MRPISTISGPTTWEFQAKRARAPSLRYTRESGEREEPASFRNDAGEVPCVAGNSPQDIALWLELCTGTSAGLAEGT